MSWPGSSLDRTKHVNICESIVRIELLSNNMFESLDKAWRIFKTQLPLWKRKINILNIIIIITLI